MARTSPLLDRHLAAGASLVPWGEGTEGADAARLVESFGEIELEYTAIRRFAAILDAPHRGVLEITGTARIEFLNRMVTHDVRTLEVGHTRRAFLTNRKGRIDADLRILHLPDRLVIDLDATVAPTVATALGAFIFDEDVAVADATERTHRLALHGPAAARLLAAVAPDHGAAIAALRPGAVIEASIAGHGVIIERWDSTGDPGFELTMPLGAAPDVHGAILGAGLPPPREAAGAPAHPFRLRRIGWHAWNIARIEAGTPVFLIDFGPSSLPAETGVLHDRVSFTKGCYPGQEVVARMQHLGRPKQVLAALRLAAPGPDPHWQPVTGAEVIPADAPADAPAIGAVTSSTRSPMLSDALICFAQVKWDHAQPGTALGVRTALGVVPGVVGDSLHFWSRAVPEPAP
jgi:folate-binding protein YgfZ